MEKPQILCYALSQTAHRMLAVLGRRFGVALRTVSPDAYRLPIAAVAGGLLPTGEGTEYTLPEPMLIFVNMPEVRLRQFLAAMREEGPRVSLKAVLTPHNAVWSAEELYRELCRERAALH